MRLPLPALALILATSPACGLWSAPEPVQSVALGDPWTTLHLPLEAGRITMSEPEALTVDYADLSPSAVGADWRASLEAAGWTLSLDSSIEGVVNQTYEKGEDVWVLAVLSREGKTTASLSVLP